jgi:hypothetical protein
VSPDIVGRLRAPRLAAAPASPQPGEEYFDTSTNVLYYWNGTMWTASGTAGTMSARMYRNAAITPAANAWVKIPLDAVSFDTSGLASTGSGRINITTAGYYQVDGCVSFGAVGVGVRTVVAIYKNGGQVTQAETDAPGAGLFPSPLTSDVIQCSAGDYLELFVYQTSAVALNPGGSSLNYLSVVLLTSLPGAVGPVTAAKAYRNAALATLSTTFAKVPLDAIVYDPGGNFSLANNRYVCPATGFYAISGACQADAPSANGINVAIYKNGGQQSQAGSVASGAYWPGVVVSDVLQCNAGDYLELWVQVGGTGIGASVGANETYLSVVQVGNSMNFTAAGGDLGGTYPNPAVYGMTGAASTTSPAAGGAGALPATPAGYVTQNVNGVSRKIPYY